MTERAEVRNALVAELANSLIPTTIMGLTLIAIGTVAFLELRAASFLWLTALGALSSAAKLSVVLYHHRRLRVAPSATLAAGQGYEAVHAGTTWVMAATIGAMGAALFRSDDMALHLVATALLFSYCSGVVSRVSVRRGIAAVAVTLAAVPCLTVAFLVGGTPHLVVAVIFLVFLLGGMESIRHAHRSASRHIDTRLRMASIARQDPLTQLLNRFGLREEFDGLVRPAGRIVALHAFDLDGFKAVNDRHGHEGGDRVLTRVADRLRALLGDGEIVARIGGDEFVVIQPEIDDDRAAGVLARRIHDALTRPYDLGEGGEIRIGVSLGYATGPAARATLEGLLRDADHMSYVVKRDGGGFRHHRGADTPEAPRRICTAEDPRAAPRRPGVQASPAGR